MAKISPRMKDVVIYTDGGCIDNPGPGGYGVVILHRKRRREISGGYKLTTNNRMELIAVIKGLESLKEPCLVTVNSDSRYVINGIEKGWAKRWRENNWMRSKKEKAENADLWEKLLKQYEKHDVTFKWVKGHAGNRWNERCDYLSKWEARKPNLPKDNGYVPKNLSKKIKITKEGQPCNHCSTPVKKRVPKQKKQRGKSYFEYYFHCPSCGTNYFFEGARRKKESSSNNQLSLL